MAVTQVARERRGVGPGELARDKEEVVAERMRLRNRDGSHQGILNASKTYVKPVANPIPGSCAVSPIASAASILNMPCVWRPPNRSIDRDSVPGGGSPAL